MSYVCGVTPSFPSRHWAPHRWALAAVPSRIPSSTVRSVCSGLSSLFGCEQRSSGPLLGAHSAPSIQLAELPPISPRRSLLGYDWYVLRSFIVRSLRFGNLWALATMLGLLLQALFIPLNVIWLVRIAATLEQSAWVHCDIIIEWRAFYLNNRNSEVYAVSAASASQSVSI